MPLSDQARIAADRDTVRIVALWQALVMLKSTVSFMNTGAHPDDETSAMLAALRFRDGIDISYACSTRGEGGQNDIGQESGAALGTLRTAEMEAACDRLDLRMYWLSVSPDDTITDFGFSKSGDETLAKWGRDRTLARFVHILRTERPDIICPTFLDVPGQHGHHRAMTEAAHVVMDLAADPAFDGSDLAPWQVKKLYLPAWSGAGQAYDDDLPPPPATMTVAGRGRDPVTGWRYARIGQQSRALHATQAMGRWVSAADETDFPLHLARSRVAGPDVDLGSGLPQTLRDLELPEAQDACDAAVAAFPNMAEVLRHGTAALQLVQVAHQNCPPDIAHKLARKQQQLARVVTLAAGVEARGWFAQDVLHPGDRARWSTDVSTDVGEVALVAKLPDGWIGENGSVQIGSEARISDPYPDSYLPDQPRAPYLEVALSVEGATATTKQRFEVTPIVLPNRAANVRPQADIINLTSERRSVSIAVSDIFPDGAAPGLDVPDGWSTEAEAGQVTVTAPSSLEPGLYDLPLTLDAEPANIVTYITRAHITQRALVAPAVARIRVVDVTLPDVRVGYVGGGSDRVGLWLDRLGLTVTDLSEEPLSDAVLEKCDTLVIGIFAMKFRKGLAEAMPRIHDWVRAGGTLVTLYHRPWDNWDANATAPYRLEIGQPSLRWRVTDENAEVTVRAPDHPLLTTPNRIGPDDWMGWQKERGLYFAKDWDAAYTPLLAMHDPGEAPLHGALLAADVGQGRHVHTSLILHHQMEKLTPGAFRLMANLLAKRV
ncbi:PIG-L family deacetylase [Tateyamaria pelophila]|uniref:PIG-L family deacetylase n=1 Tax=Tateyamaria pelophila TaxID=328415 RepID=UPI001CBE1EBE|nr:PIG-L family deacetylase [Tateyamaria pelophila]